MTSEIRRAIDGNLSGLQLTEGDVARIMHRVYQEKTILRRPAPYRGLAMAAVLVVLIVGAVGMALTNRQPVDEQITPLSSPVETAFVPIDDELTARELIDQHALPMALENTDLRYTVEQSQKLMDMARQYGFTLMEKDVQTLQADLTAGYGCKKFELINAIAKADLGEHFFTWSLEDQAWLDDIHVQIGYQSSRLYTVPGENELTPEQVKQIALDEMLEIWQGAYYGRLLLDNAYVFGIQHLTTDTDRPEEDDDYYDIKQERQYTSKYMEPYSGLYWKAIWRPITLSDRGFTVYIDYSGKVLGMYDRDTGVNEGSPIERMLKRFKLFYGEISAWDQATVQLFHEWAKVSGSTNDKGVLCLQKTQFPDIPAGGMTAQQALEHAAAAQGWQHYTLQSSVYTVAQGNPVWRLQVMVDETYYVEVDSATGKVTSIVRNNDNTWYWQLAPQSIIDEVESTWEYQPTSFG